jgi:hypothetical protein
MTTKSAKATDRPVKIHIRQMMTDEEFHATGLNKLSSTQLEFLDAWLNMHRAKLAPGNQPHGGGNQ